MTILGVEMPQSVKRQDTGWTEGARFPAEVRNFFHSTASTTASIHGYRDNFHKGKAAGA